MGDKTLGNEEIVRLISTHPEGISIPRLLSELPVPVNHRTLQRRLKALIEKGIVTRHGQGKNSYYKVGVGESTTSSSEITISDELQISAKSEQIRNAIHQPIAKRKKVGYLYSFLEKYRPNETFYLKDNEREYLKALNSQSDGDLPAGTFARKILDRFLIDLSWNSSRLEGNTFSLLETEQLLFQGDDVNNKTPSETQMILNHKNAIEFLVESSADIDFNKFTICNLHAMLADNLLSNPLAYGRVRNIAVGIGNSVYHPLDIPQLLDDYLEQLLFKASKINNPFEQAFFAMVQLPYLQPFEDVNKRVSRLSANIPFIKNNYSPISFVDVSKKTYVDGLLGVYELNKIDLLKDVFLWAYERSVYRYAKIRHTIGEPDRFRLQYRHAIYELVKDIVSKAQSKGVAIDSIRNYADLNLPLEDKERFIEVVETELLSLHAGNFARYRITPNEFKCWQEIWS